MGPMRIRFDGKTVAVSGAGHGFGRCIAETFAQRGARVFGCDLSAAELAETATAGVEAEVVDLSDRVAAAASFYGTWLVSDAAESPHLSLGKGKAELYIACAEHDELAPLPMVEELRGLFDRAGAPGELELYPGVHHGFAFPQRKVYDKPAAERHWERLIALYRRRLG